MAIGTGSAKEEDGDAIMREWRNAAASEEEKGQRRKPVFVPSGLSHAGIAVRKVKL